jgi:hypothetical protein
VSFPPSPGFLPSWLVIRFSFGGVKIGEAGGKLGCLGLQAFTATLETDLAHTLPEF